MFRSPFTACVFAFLATLANSAAAQNFGSGMSAFNRSSVGSSGFGSSGFGSSGFGSSGFGSGGFGSSGFGSSGVGSSGFGSSGFGSSGFGGSSMGMGGFGQSGMGGSGFGGQGFGGGYGGGQNFVGRDATDMNASFSQMGQAGTQFFNQMNRNMRRANSGQSTTKKIENPKQEMRVSLQVAFAAPIPTSTALANNIQTRIASIPAVHNIAQPLVTMEGDIAVLRGVAPTESQRLVLERLVMLEPGVRGVRNEMTVTPPAPADTLPSAGN